MGGGDTEVWTVWVSKVKVIEANDGVKYRVGDQGQELWYIWEGI